MFNLVAPVAWAAGFNPASLFAGGYAGAWYDPSDLATLFQDSAGATPVTGDGDPIGLVLDKSGNGNNWVQPTSALRPVWHTAGGLSWIEVDGGDDLLETAAVFTLGQPLTLSMAASYPSSTSTTITGFLTLLVNSANYMFIGVMPTNQRARTQMWGVAVSPGVTVIATGGAGTTYPNTSPAVVSGQVTSNFEDTRVNGVQKATATTNWDAQTLANAKLRLGHSTGAVPLAVKMYGAFAIGRTLAAADLLELEQFLGAKCGVSF